MLLKSIATFLGHKFLTNKDLENLGDFFAIGDFVFKNEMSGYRREINNFFDQGFKEKDDVRNKRRTFMQGFAAYGPYRLDIVSERSGRQKFISKLSKKGSFESLFGTGQPLLNLNKQLEYWRKGSKRERQFFEERKFYIVTVLTQIITNLIDVQFRSENYRRYTEYIFINKDSDQKQILKWDELSSGLRNMIALIGDILIRMYDQQRDIIDPAELRGIVLIDEIDLHLHPKAQKDIIINLTKVFPNIQFIVSTHSPIPLLGAPQGSAIFVVKMDPERGVYTERLEDLEKNFKNLMPNALLTSELFDLEEITHKDANAEDVNTSDNYEKYRLDIELDRQLKILNSQDNETFNDFLK